jgi:hypothetical protein
LKAAVDYLLQALKLIAVNLGSTLGQTAPPYHRQQKGPVVVDPKGLVVKLLPHE